jgi:hypothetical protein
VKLEQITKGTQVNGILPNSVVTIVDAQWHGSDVVELTYKDASGALGSELVFRDKETTLSILTKGGAWQGKRTLILQCLRGQGFSHYLVF